MIPNVVANNKDLSTLAAAFKDAALKDADTGLSNNISGQGPFTLFAPSNGAFDVIPDATLTSLLNNKSALTTVLKYHVASGTHLSTDLKDGSTLMTLEGHDVNVIVNKDGGVKINGITVTTADMKASNGVVHIIDEPLLPPGFVLPKPPTPPSTCNAKMMVGVDCDTDKDISSRPVKSRDECCDLCAKTKECMAWTWNENVAADPYQLCFVKKACKDTKKDYWGGLRDHEYMQCLQHDGRGGL